MEKTIELKMREIQNKFNFEIPNYILEIIPKGDTSEIRVFIGLALVNNRISEEQANILISEFCEKSKEKSRVLELLSANY